MLNNFRCEIGRNCTLLFLPIKNCQSTFILNQMLQFHADLWETIDCSNLVSLWVSVECVLHIFWNFAMPHHYEFFI